MYSSPSLITPPYLPRNCGLVGEVAFGEKDIVNTLIAVAPNIYSRIREGGLCLRVATNRGTTVYTGIPV